MTRTASIDAETIDAIRDDLRDGGLTLSECESKHGVNPVVAKAEIIDVLPVKDTWDSEAGERRFYLSERERIFMTHDDIPDDFLESMNDGLAEDDILDELEDNDIDAEDPYTVIDDLEDLGYQIGVERDDGQNVYTIEGVESPEFSTVETKRVGSSTKASITREVNNYLEQKEREIKGYREQIDVDQPAAEYTEGAYDQIVHFSDVHFGDEITDERGDIIYDSEIAQNRVKRQAARAIEMKEEKEAAGHDVENAVVLLGGDLVTNESIYDHQPHDIDETVDEQIKRATATFLDVIEAYSQEYEHVKVVCQHGNHGEFRVDGSSPQANADDFIYDNLEMFVTRQDDLDNVAFAKSDVTPSTTFEFRDHTGYIEHGDDVLEHIGTSAGKRRWYARLEDNDFDVGFRGHYHVFKEEPIHGRPVFLAPSPAPGDDFSKSIGEHSDEELIGYTVFASDDQPVEDVKKIYKS